MTHSDSTIKHAAKLLRKHAAFAAYSFAELILAVQGTAILSPNAKNAAQLARDTYRSEHGHEGRKHAVTNMRGGTRVDGVDVDYFATISDTVDEFAELEAQDAQDCVIGKIRSALGNDIADGILAGMTYADIAEIIGTSAATICRRVADCRSALCGEFS